MIPAHRRQRQEDQKFKLLLSYIVSLRLTWATLGSYLKKKKKKERGEEKKKRLEGRRGFEKRGEERRGGEGRAVEGRGEEELKRKERRGGEGGKRTEVFQIAMAETFQNDSKDTIKDLGNL